MARLHRLRNALFVLAAGCATCPAAIAQGPMILHDGQMDAVTAGVTSVSSNHAVAHASGPDALTDTTTLSSDNSMSDIQAVSESAQATAVGDEASATSTTSLAAGDPSASEIRVNALADGLSGGENIAYSESYGSIDASSSPNAGGVTAFAFGDLSSWSISTTDLTTTAGASRMPLSAAADANAEGASNAHAETSGQLSDGGRAIIGRVYSNASSNGTESRQAYAFTEGTPVGASRTMRITRSMGREMTEAASSRSATTTISIFGR